MVLHPTSHTTCHFITKSDNAQSTFTLTQTQSLNFTTDTLTQQCHLPKFATYLCGIPSLPTYPQSTLMHTSERGAL